MKRLIVAPDVLDALAAELGEQPVSANGEHEFAGWPDVAIEVCDNLPPGHWFDPQTLESAFVPRGPAGL